MKRSTGASRSERTFPSGFARISESRPHGSVAIGTATDPYQPIEGKYKLTRRCLEALVDYPMPTSIVTKGPLVVRDIDVLKELDEKTERTVYFSVPCVDEEVVRKTDPGTAPPLQRLRALRMLREAGIDAAVLCMPVLPGISDSEESLDAAAPAASEAGATAFRHRPLKIDVEIQQYYYDFLASEFPVAVPSLRRALSGRSASGEGLRARARAARAASARPLRIPRTADATCTAARSGDRATPARYLAAGPRRPAPSHVRYGRPFAP